MTAKTPDPQESPAASSTAATTTPAATPVATPAAAPAAPPAAKAAPAAPPPAKAAPPPRPPAAPRPQSNGSGVAGGAFVTAVCALLVAIGAVGVAVYSLKVARDALSKNADQAPAAIASATPTTEPVVAANSPAPTGSVPRLQYFTELVRVELKIPAPTSCNASYVDIDTMAIGIAAGHEFYLSTCRDPLVPEFRIDQTSGASTSSANPNPDVCAALMAGTQSTPELVLTARAGLTFCLLTNKASASAQNLPQRLAIVEVRDVAVDRSVTVAVSTFRIG
jgi:hypothetical protein